MRSITIEGLNFRVVILLLKSYGVFNFFFCEFHTYGRTHKLIFDIIVSMNDTDNFTCVALYGCINAQKIDVKLLAVAAEHAGDKSVVDFIYKVVFFFFVYVTDRSVDTDIHDLAKV